MRNVALIAVLACLTSGAWGSNVYSVAYEGDSLPPSDPNWHRYHSLPWAIRTIETDPADPNNHFLVINSLLDQMIYDYVQYPRQMDPDGPNELFYVQWRLLIAESHGHGDQAVGFTSDSANQFSFGYEYDRVYDSFGGWSRSFAPGVFHTYRLESTNMITYRLWIDGQLARQAPWFKGTGHPSAGFGDCVQGGDARSIGKWDYLKFGVTLVPEPDPALLATIVVISLCHRARRHGR